MWLLGFSAIQDCKSRQDYYSIAWFIGATSPSARRKYCDNAPVEKLFTQGILNVDTWTIGCAKECSLVYLEILRVMLRCAQTSEKNTSFWNISNGKNVKIAIKIARPQNIFFAGNYSCVSGLNFFSSSLSLSLSLFLPFSPFCHKFNYNFLPRD